MLADVLEDSQQLLLVTEKIKGSSGILVLLARYFKNVFKGLLKDNFINLKETLRVGRLKTQHYPEEKNGEETKNRAF